MRRPLYLPVVLALIAVAYWAGARRGQQHAASHESRETHTILYYVDPMNPAHTSKEPGKAPCGMDMEPVYADAMSASASGAGSASLPPGTIKVTPEKQQLVGVRLATAEKKKLAHNFRLLGKVATDETRIYRINATVDGWITKTMPVSAGSRVKKDETIAEFYSPEFLAAGQALVYALASADRVKTTGKETEMQRSQMANFDLNLKQQRDALRSLGMGELQIQEMVRTRKLMETVNITSPSEGFILQRNVSDGQRFERGTELFRIADLSRVWILADVFEDEAEYVQPGAQVRVSLPKQHLTFMATVSKTLPQFDSGSRTLKVRLETDNPDFALKPDMFVDVEIPIELPESLVVAADAVLDAGRRKTVFVDRGEGMFEPRVVETGRRLGDQIEILQGLVPGERVVTSGTFLLDSESRMKLAAAGVHGAPAKDPVCGMMVDESKAKAEKRVTEHSGRTFYFCNDDCKRSFDKEPAKFMEKAGGTPTVAMKPPVAAASPDITAVDPVCGMKVSQAKAKAANRVSEHQGKTYFFCNDGCKRTFVENPGKFTNKSGEPGRDSHQAHLMVDAPTMTDAGSHDSKPAPMDDPAPTLKDPVCGMEVDELKAKAASLQSTHDGITVFFCSPACKGKFDKAPDKFLKETKEEHDDPPAKPAPAGATKPRN